MSGSDVAFTLTSESTWGDGGADGVGLGVGSGVGVGLGVAVGSTVGVAVSLGAEAAGRDAEGVAGEPKEPAAANRPSRARARHATSRTAIATADRRLGYAFSRPRR